MAGTAGDLGPVQVLRRTGLSPWQWEAGVRAGLIPAADVAGGRWSAAVAEEVAARCDRIVAAVGTEAPVGAGRCAERLSRRLGLDVRRPDVETLAGRGLLAAVGEYKGWDLYDVRAVDELDAALVTEAVTGRLTWTAASLDVHQAADLLGWRREEFLRVAAERGLGPGRLGRYARSDLDALAAEEDLGGRVRAERLLGPDQAAAHLEVRRTDLGYLTGGGLLVARDHVRTRVTRHRWVTVPLYRTGDLDDLEHHPDLPWEELRAVRPGRPSPLRGILRRPPDRAAAVRHWVAGLGDRHGVETWAWWHPGAGRWEIDYERGPHAPTVDRVRAELADHPALARHAAAGGIVVATEAGAALRWARAMRAPGTAVILATETTDLDGVLVEVAVIDAATGDTLLDTLVRPDTPISDGARWVHGLADADVAHAPPLAEVLPRLLAVTTNRTVIAYNADFDSARITAHARRDGLDPAHLADPDTWACLMRRRSDWALRWRRLPLGGGHRALGDCRTAHDLLRAMTGPHRAGPAAR